MLFFCLETETEEHDTGEKDYKELVSEGRGEVREQLQIGRLDYVQGFLSRPKSAMVITYFIEDEC